MKAELHKTPWMLGCHPRSGLQRARHAVKIDETHQCGKEMTVDSPLRSTSCNRGGNCCWQ